MKKKILSFILVIFLINFVSATLNQDQLNEAISKFQQKVPNCPVDQIKSYILSKDCAPNTMTSSESFNCGDQINHEYVCNLGIHYLDGEVISILSSKNEYNTAQTNAPNSLAVAGTSNVVVQENKSWFIKLFWSEGTIGGIIIGGVVSLIVGIALFEYRKRRNKKNSKNFEAQSIKEEVKEVKDE